MNLGPSNSRLQSSLAWSAFDGGFDVGASAGRSACIKHSPAAASEIPKEHPMLVITTQHFNEKTGSLIGLSLIHS